MYVQLLYIQKKKKKKNERGACEQWREMGFIELLYLHL